LKEKTAENVQNKAFGEIIYLKLGRPKLKGKR
jgi:hypothetical protein